MGHTSRKRSVSASSRGDRHNNLGPVAEESDKETSDSESETASTSPKSKRDDLMNPYWIEDPEVLKGEVEFLSSAEMQFWKDLLDKYLFPIDENPEEKVIFLQMNK